MSIMLMEEQKAVCDYSVSGFLTNLQRGSLIE